MTLGDVGSVVGACIAVGALVVALLARTDSKVSARASATSAASSERSAKTAEQSLELSRLESERRVERTDVEWKSEGGKSSYGLITYRNVGTTTAHAVTIVLTVNDQRYDLEPGDVAPDGTVEHDSRDIYTRASNDLDATTRSLSNSGVAYFGTTHFEVTARISWQTELGTPYIRTL
jgi:hypothetical protein